MDSEWPLQGAIADAMSKGQSKLRIHAEQGQAKRVHPVLPNNAGNGGLQFAEFQWCMQVCDIIYKAGSG